MNACGKSPVRARTYPPALYQRYLIVTTAASSFIQYRNTVTGSVQNDVPSPTLGGLLADSMGLGKSLVALALVAADVAKARASKIEHSPTLVIAPRSSKVALRVWDWIELTPYSPYWLARSNRVVCTRGLLKVGPVSYANTKIDRLTTVSHFKRGTFRLHLYYGDQRARNAECLSSHDIVLTTYDTLVAEKPKGLLRGVAWRRVVLDEGA